MENKIFITLGSQKFQFNRLLKAVDELCEKGTVDAEDVFAQIGYSDYLPKNFSYKKFLDRDEFSNEMEKANIVITHGGTGAIIGAVKKGKKVIAVPRLAKYGEHVDDHQLQLIKQFDDLNLIWEYFSVKRIQPKVFKRVSTYSIPLIPNNLAWWVVNASDRTIIAHFLGTAANGIYSIANKFPNVFINFYNILNLSWTETVSLHYGDEDRDEFLTETMTSLFKLFAAACFGIVACMPFIFPILINTKYDAAYNQILILMYAMLFRVLVGLYSCVYVAQKNAKKIAYTSISAAIINITVDLILINKIQVFAASVSTLVAFLSMFVIRYIDVNKTVHMKIRKPIIVGSVLIGGMLIGTYYCGNKIIQFVALCITAIYAMLTNVDMLKSGVNLVKSRLGK